MSERRAQSSNTLPIPAKLFFNRREIVSLTGLSLRFVDSLIADGMIRVKRVGDRVLIPRRELLRFAELTDGTENTR
jgi:excisionase family DNA binding protein